MSFESDLYNLIAQQLPSRVAALELGSNLPSGTWWAFKLPANSIEGIVTVANFTGDYWAITENTIATPTWPDDYTWGVPPATYVMQSLLAWTASQRLRFWQYRDGTHTEIMDINGESGILVTATPQQAPEQITDFSIDAVTATTITTSFSSTTIIDDVTLQYDIIDILNNNAVLSADVTPGTVIVTGLFPSTDYTLAVNVYPASNVGDTTTRASISNTDSDTTSAIGTINTFTVANVSDTGGPGNAAVTLTVSSGAIDEAILQVDDPTKPSSNDTSWDLITNWTSGGVDVVTYGSHTVYAWARDGSFPTSLTPVASDPMTATDTGGSGAVLGFQLSALTLYEERSETASITIERSADTSGTSSVRVTSSAGTGASPAAVGVNYQSVDSIVSFAASATTATVSLPLIWANLGFNTASLLLSLSDVSSGDTIDSGSDELAITIEGTQGYWSLAASAVGSRDGDIDIFNPPSLPKVGVQTLTGTGSETLDYVEIDAGGLSNAIVIGDGVANKTIENCVITNAGLNGVKIAGGNAITIRNCLIHNTGNANPAHWMSAGVFITGASVTDPSNVDILGNRFLNNSNAIFIEYGTMDDIRILNNFHTNDGGVHSFMDDGTGKYHRYLGMQFSTLTNFEFNDNIGYMPTVYDSDKFDRDAVNTFASQGTSGSHAQILRNTINMESQPGFSSGLGFIIGDRGENGFWDCKYNTNWNSGSVGIGVAGGDTQTVLYNDLYSSPGWSGLASNGVGQYAWRQARDGRAGPGTFKSANIGYNRIFWLNSANQVNPKWFPATGSDGLLPNHGATVGLANTAITNWSTDIDMSSSWGIAGDARVGGRLHVLDQPAADEDILVMYASSGSAAGNGVLRFTNATPDTLEWAEYNDSFGAAVDLTGNGLSGHSGDERFEVFSANGNSIVIWVSSSYTLSTTTEWTVHVTNENLFQMAMYPGETGLWAGGGGSSPTDTTAPTVPTNGSASPGATTPATTLDLTWTKSTDAGGMGGYYVYRGSTLIATLPGDPASPSYTDVGLTEDVLYTYQVAAYDTSGNISEKSDFFSGTPTAGTNLITNGEFNDTTSWTVQNGTFSVSSGIATITNDVSGTPNCRLYNTTPLSLSGSTSYTLTLAHKGQYNNPTNARGGRVVIYQGSSNQYYTNMTTGGEQSFQNDATMTEHVMVFTTPATANAISVILWVNDPDAPGFTQWDYMRLQAT